MPVNFGLLSNAALTGLSEQERDDLQKQATTQFLLGSLLSNDPSLGLKSALSVPEQYTSAQKSIIEAQEKKRQRGEVSSFLEEFSPDPMQAQRQALNANLGRPRMASSPYSLATSLGLPKSRVEPQTTNQPIDYQKALAASLRLAGNPAQAQIRETLSAMQPRVQGNLVLDANQRPMSGLPTFDAQRGLVVNPTVRDGNVTFNVTDAPGFVGATARNTLPPLSQNQEYVFDRNGNPTGIRTASGAIQSIGEIEGAKAQAQAQGQVERVINPDGTERFVPRSSLLNQPTSTNTGTGDPSGNISKVSPAQATLDEASKQRFTTFSAESAAGAKSATGRKLAGEQLYDLSTRIQNNRLTGLQAGAYGFMNAIPGIGKMFEQDIVDITRMNQSIATAQLETTKDQKGAASNLDAQVIARGYASLNDPAAATRLLAVQEIALADRDIARNQFVENYTGDPGKIGTAWAKSPDNKPIFNHPKFDQFLKEQIAANPQKPTLPAGFQLVQGRSGRYGIKKPDGSVMTIDQ